MTREKKPLFFKSEQNISGEKINTNELAQVISHYINTISSGDYDFKIPKAKDNFTDQQKAYFIKKLLNNSSLSFQLSEVPDLIETNLLNIVNLAASLKLFEAISPLEDSSAKLVASDKIGIAPFIQVGMPGPIIIYVDLLEKSHRLSADKITFIGQLTEQLDKLALHAHTFTKLGQVAFKSLFERWAFMLNTLDKKQQAMLTKQLTEFERINKTLMNRDVGVQFTFIDKCIATIWDRLDIDLGKKILKEENSVESTNYIGL